jgi:hypothetical protein
MPKYREDTLGPTRGVHFAFADRYLERHAMLRKKPRSVAEDIVLRSILETGY